MMLLCPYQESAEDLSGSTEQLQIANYSHKTDIQPWDLSPSETVNQWIDIENNKNNKWKNGWNSHYQWKFLKLKC